MDSDVSQLWVQGISFVLILLILLLVARRKKRRQSSNSAGWVFPAIKLFVFGVLLSFGWTAFSLAREHELSYRFLTESPQVLIGAGTGGVSVVLIFLIIRVPLSYVNAVTAPVLIAGVGLFRHAVSTGILFLTLSFSNRLSPSFQSYFSDPRHWLPSPDVPAIFFELLDAILVFGACYYVAFGLHAPARPSTSFSRPQYGGSPMSTDEPTRLLCASAFLCGEQFRKDVLKHLQDRNRAFAPEIGLNVRLLAQVCQFVQKRESRLPWLFLLASLAAGVITASKPLAGLIAWIAFCGVIYLTKLTQNRSIVRKYFSPGKFAAEDVNARMKAELPEGCADLPPTQNLIVYSGFTPFVGAGVELGGWSFVIDVDKPASRDLLDSQDSDPLPFTVDELYGAVDTAVASLRLERLSIDDYCFVSGSEIREDREILAEIHGRPQPVLAAARLECFRRSSDPRIRHYQWIRVQDWGNDLVMSYFFRCALRGSSLFIEINRFLLPPLDGRYRAIDRMAAARTSTIVGEAIGSFIVGPFYAIASPFILLVRFQHWLGQLGGEDRIRRREIEDNPLFDYGTATSLRSKFSGNSFSHYFQKLDGDFYRKVLEHEILDALVEFLEERNIDTSEIKERRTTILNSGVIVQGGDVTAESLAVGVGASAVSEASSKSNSKRKTKGAAA